MRKFLVITLGTLLLLGGPFLKPVRAKVSVETPSSPEHKNLEAWRQSYLDWSATLGASGDIVDEDGKSYFLIKKIISDQAAEQAGLKVGDKIANFNGHLLFCSQATLKQLIRFMGTEDTHTVNIVRDAQLLALKIKFKPEQKLMHAVNSLTPEDLLDEFLDATRDKVIAKVGNRVNLEEARQRLLPKVKACTDRHQLYRLLNKFIDEFDASHMTLLSREAIECDVKSHSEGLYIAGCHLIQQGRYHYVCRIFHDSAARRAGIQLGDRIVSINGVPAEKSPTLITTMFNAGYAPPLYFMNLIPFTDHKIVVQKHHPDSRKTVILNIKNLSGFYASSTTSRKIIKTDSHNIAYVHLWTILRKGMYDLFKDVFNNEFSKADGAILDLRGHGGQLQFAYGIVKLLEGYKKPLVILIDRHTVSAKEVTAALAKKHGIGTLVGEKSSGALLAVKMHRLKDGALYEYPFIDREGLNIPIDPVENVGVTPHVEVDYDFPFLAGRDPVMEAGKKELLRQLNNSKQASAK